MKKNHLVVVALTIFISFGVFVSIKQGQSASDQAKDQAYDNESRIIDLESQIIDLEMQIQDLEYHLR